MFPKNVYLTKLTSACHVKPASPSVRISKVEVDEHGSKDDADHAEADHGEVEPDVELHQLVLDDRSILRDLRADPDHLVLSVGLDHVRVGDGRGRSGSLRWRQPKNQ